jgi:aminopeptidase N
MRACPLTLLLLASVQVMVPPLSQASVDPAPGIAETLAAARDGRIEALRYALEFRIPARPEDPIEGQVAIRFTLKDVSQPLVLDFAGGAERVRSLNINQVPARYRAMNGHLVVPAGALRTGEQTIAIEFLTGGAPLHRNPDFLYTLFVPARAHLAFPCIDQPSLKARYTLALEVPAAWEVVANGAEIGREQKGDRVRVRFAETPPLPTYLFAFAAGRFQVESARRNGRLFRMFHRETDTAKVARNREAIFDLHAAALAWLEQYTGIPYPFGKLDIVLIPCFQFSGMEHAGAIFYNASGLLLEA